MCNDKKISVVIPYYKGEKYIEQAVESIIKQPYSNIEILLINDGSPDNGDDICKELLDKYPNIKYYKKDNEGIGATRNFGIERATGEYIAFLDQDDVWVKDFLDEETAMSIFNGGDAVCFSYYNCNGVFTRGMKVFVGNRVLYGGGVDAMNAAWQHHSSIFFRRKTILDCNIRCPLARHEDEIFRHKFMYVSKQVTFIDKVMFLYRNNASSETHRKQNAELLYGPLLKSWEELLKWFESLYSEDEKAKRFVKNMICIYAIEGIESLYTSGRKNSIINSLVNSYFSIDYLADYKGIVWEEKQYNRINEYFENRKIFVRKNRIKGYKMKIGRILIKFSLVKRKFYENKYPTTLNKELLY